MILLLDDVIFPQVPTFLEALASDPNARPTIPQKVEHFELFFNFFFHFFAFVLTHLVEWSGKKPDQGLLIFSKATKRSNAGFLKWVYFMNVL